MQFLVGEPSDDVYDDEAAIVGSYFNTFERNVLTVRDNGPGLWFLITDLSYSLGSCADVLGVDINGWSCHLSRFFRFYIPDSLDEFDVATVNDSGLDLLEVVDSYSVQCGNAADGKLVVFRVKHTSSEGPAAFQYGLSTCGSVEFFVTEILGDDGYYAIGNAFIKIEK